MQFAKALPLIDDTYGNVIPSTFPDIPELANEYSPIDDMLLKSNEVNDIVPLNASFSMSMKLSALKQKLLSDSHPMNADFPIDAEFPLRLIDIELTLLFS